MCIHVQKDMANTEHFGICYLDWLIMQAGTALATVAVALVHRVVTARFQHAATATSCMWKLRSFWKKPLANHRPEISRYVLYILQLPAHRSSSWRFWQMYWWCCRCRSLPGLYRLSHLCRTSRNCWAQSALFQLLDAVEVLHVVLLHLSDLVLEHLDVMLHELHLLVHVKHLSVQPERLDLFMHELHLLTHVLHHSLHQHHSRLPERQVIRCCVRHG